MSRNRVLILNRAPFATTSRNPVIVRSKRHGRVLESSEFVAPEQLTPRCDDARAERRRDYRGRLLRLYEVRGALSTALACEAHRHDFRTTDQVGR
jgi:hypothetical protein